VNTDVPTLPLAPEYPVDLVVDGTKVTTLMCTPASLEELAAGHLYCTGMIRSRAQLASISVLADGRTVMVKLNDSAGLDDCPRKSAAVRWPVSLADLQRKAAEMFSMAEMYRRTGGMHCAALWTAENTFTVREDVGRHNAVDKVIGRGLLDGIDLEQAILLTSGRFAADMVIKAKNAGICFLVTRSIPTSTAYNIAVEAGMTLVGRIERADPILYNRTDRIALIARP